jgi:hypothetical protein
MNFLNLVQGAAGKVKGVATLLSGLTKTQAIIAGSHCDSSWRCWNRRIFFI